MKVRRIFLSVCSIGLVSGVMPAAIGSPNFALPQTDVQSISFQSEVRGVGDEPQTGPGLLTCRANLSGVPDYDLDIVTVTIGSSCNGLPVERLAAGPIVFNGGDGTPLGNPAEVSCQNCPNIHNVVVFPCHSDCLMNWSVDGSHHFRPGYGIQIGNLGYISLIRYYGDNNARCGADDGGNTPNTRDILRNIEAWCDTHAPAGIPG